MYTHGVMAAATRRARRARPHARSRYGRETFDSPAEAARVFYNANELFFDHVLDPRDGIREWADGRDVRVGRDSYRRLKDSAAGRKILSARQGEPQILAALQWVFQQAKGRRWDAVNWDDVEELGQSLEPLYEPPAREAGTPGLYWWPVVGAGKPVAERLEELEPFEALELGRAESAAELERTLDELRETYAATRDCLSPRLRATVERRLEQWGAWVDDPEAIPAYACEPDPASQGYVCNYPIVAGELRELRGACRQSYDPDWFVDEALAGEPGFPPMGDPRGAIPVPDEDGAPAGPRDDVPVPSEAPQELEPGECPPPAFRQLQDGGRAYGANRDNVAEVRLIGDVLYQLEWRNNRVPGSRRGPYWYAYFGQPRRTVYIGKRFRELELELED